MTKGDGDALNDSIQLGSWDFNIIKLEDMNMYNQYIKETEYPASLWSSTFPYLWASSQSSSKKVLWRIVDDMLVTFINSNRNSLYLACLPYGKGDANKVVDVLYKCMEYCYNWNNQDSDRTILKMINEVQLEFLKKCPKFNKRFKAVNLVGIERHYSVKNLASLAGKDFLRLRHDRNKFFRENPDIVVHKYNDKDYKEILELSKQWSISAEKRYSNIFDKVYFKMLIKYGKELGQNTLVLRKGNKIVGVIAGCILPTGQAWGSVTKYEPGIRGLSETVIIEFIKEINRINPNVEYINVGSDLGPGGLRDYKLKFRPVLNYKRYRVYLISK